SRSLPAILSFPTRRSSDLEPILEPDIAIVDPHHHLWLRGDHRYLLDELLADLNTGHNVVATVFEECHSMYRAGGPAEMRPRCDRSEEHTSELQSRENLVCR